MAPGGRGGSGSVGFRRASPDFPRPGGIETGGRPEFFGGLGSGSGVGAWKVVSPCGRGRGRSFQRLRTSPITSPTTSTAPTAAAATTASRPRDCRGQVNRGCQRCRRGGALRTADRGAATFVGAAGSGSVFAGIGSGGGAGGSPETHQPAGWGRGASGGMEAPGGTRGLS